MIIAKDIISDAGYERIDWKFYSLSEDNDVVLELKENEGHCIKVDTLNKIVVSNLECSFIK